MVTATDKAYKLNTRGAKEVSKTKFLTKAEVRELIKKSREGDQDARDLIVEKNTRLVWNTVQRFINRGYEPEDLFQIGCIGLLKSIDKFDLSYDVQFSTYAVPMIIGEIQRFLRDDGIVKVSRSIKETANKIMRAKLNDASVEVIIEKLELDNTEFVHSLVEETLKYIKNGRGYAKSLEETVYENDGDPITLADQLPGDVNGKNWLDNIALKEALSKLNEREKMIVYLRYYQDRTQSEAAQALGVSQVQVSRLEKKILLKLKTLADVPADKPAVTHKSNPKQKGEVIVVRYKNAKGDREKAIELLKTTEMSAKDIAAETGVPYGSMCALAKKHRPKEIHDRVVQRSREENSRKWREKREAKEVKQAASDRAKAIEEAAAEELAKMKAPMGVIPTAGLAAPGPEVKETEFNELMEMGAPEYAPLPTFSVNDNPIPTQYPGNYGISMPTPKEEPNTAKVEYNFNFNVSGKQVSVDEVIAKLDELKTVLKHIQVDAVNFRVNVGS